MTDPNVIGQSCADCLVQVRRPFFGLGTLWHVSLGEDRYGTHHLLWVGMLDDDFAKKLENGNNSVREGDTLKVTLRTLQFYDQEAGLCSRCDILKVLEIREWRAVS